MLEIVEGALAGDVRNRRLIVAEGNDFRGSNVVGRHHGGGFGKGREEVGEGCWAGRMGGERTLGQELAEVSEPVLIPETCER